MKVVPGSFWARLTKIVTRLVKTHAHGQVTLIFEKGVIKRVLVNRNYLPEELPDIPPDRPDTDLG